jgi:septal ring factor EnvC (AmiA/AmiB activator)
LEEDLAMAGKDPDSFYNDEMRDLQRDSDIHRLSHRMVLLFIIIPSILCAVFGFAYMDIRGKLLQLQSTGSEEVQALSDDVVNKVAALSEQYKKLEESLGESLSTLKKSSASMQDALKKNQQRITKITTSKADKKALEKAEKKRSAEIAATSSALKKNISEQKAAVKTLTAKLNKALDDEANAITAFQSDVREQREQIAETVRMIEALQNKGLKHELDLRLLSEGKIDKQEWEDFRKSESKRVAHIEKMTKSLSEDISWLEKRLKMTREKAKVNEAKSGKPIPTLPDSGQIVEQEIKE